MDKNTLAYNIHPFITAVKSLLAQVPNCISLQFFL
jgi:hypothetical protein